MENEKNTSFWNRLGMAMKKLLRFIAVLIIFAGVVAGIYYGTPFLYEKFVMPIEKNAARLSEIEGDLETDMAFLVSQFSSLQSRQIEFENLLTENTNDMTEISVQIQILEQEIEGHDLTLSKLEEIQVALDTLEATSDDYSTFMQQKDYLLSELQRQIVISRSVELLSRARLFLSQSNFDQSKRDIQSARNLLINLAAEEMPVDDGVALQVVIDRLDLALNNLPLFPVIAVDDVDIAWDLLVSGVSDPITEMEVTSTPDGTEPPMVEATPTATP